MADANTDSSVFPFPIPEGPPSVRPASAPFNFELSVSQRIVHETSSTLKDLGREMSSLISYPVIFIGGSALGILIACIVVAISHHNQATTATVSAATTAPIAAGFSSQPQWAPLPVVTIHPAPPEPVAVPAPIVEAPIPAPVAVARAPRTPRRFVKAARPQPRIVASPRPSSAVQDVLADAL